MKVVQISQKHRRHRGYLIVMHLLGEKQACVSPIYFKFINFVFKSINFVAEREEKQKSATEIT
jgi:hypothetical protein